MSTSASARAVALAETDPVAAGLGYKADATKVDAKKYPTYVSGRQCAGCQLYAGKPADATAPCAIFSGKLVSGKGWCTAWAKKA
ncbi:MAG: high-potential iron-sulfur protein [Pseudomonadota bacterium]|nr:high-potential iron-sulfur protein [Pseudomonadota bacterium]